MPVRASMIFGTLGKLAPNRVSWSARQPICPPQREILTRKLWLIYKRRNDPSRSRTCLRSWIYGGNRVLR